MLPFAAALAVTLGLSAGAAAQDKVLFQYSWIPTGEYAVYSAGMQRGFYRDAGIDLSVSTGRGSGDAVKKVAGGGAPFGDGDISALMAARVREKAPVKCIMGQYTMSPHSLFVLESSGIKSFKDLEGKTLVTTAGNSHYLYFPLVAKMSGLDPTKVKWVTADAATMAPMLITGRVDGAPLFATHEYYQNKQAEKVGQKIKVIPFADYGFKIYSYCLFARDETIKNQPDLVRRFLQATQRAFLWTKDNIEEAAKIHNKVNPDVAIDDAMGSMRVMVRYMFNDATQRDGFGFFNPTQLQETYKVVAQSQDLDPNVDVSQFVDTSLLAAKTN
jgi:NitT/TauT family transport system substrate-binding protein